jgi:hypothetical protein
MLQVPVLHEAVPFALLHTVPQAPQLLTLVFLFVSQPSEYSPLQSA